MTLLEVNNIESGYGKTTILFNITIAIEEGEIVAMIGPNGAGKTTLLRSIVGLLNIKKGSITFKNERIESIRPDERVQSGIGYVPQHENVFPTLTVIENLEMGAYLLPDHGDRLDTIFSLFPRLEERNAQKAATLSGGERQMLAIASTLLLTPDLLMLDEPCGGLAPLVAEEVGKTILNIHKEGTTILWVVERDIESILKMVSRSYVMESGKIHFEGTGEELLAEKKYQELILGEH